MPAAIIDGRSVSEARRAPLAERVRALLARSIQPCLAAVSVREDHGWSLYLKNQASACAAVGIRHRRLDLPAGAQMEDLAEAIEGLNLDPQVHGIILQSPLQGPGAGELDELRAQAQLSPDKDVEGVNPANLGLLLGAKQALAPCTALSALALALAGCQLLGRADLVGIEACVVGASTVVGKPIAQLLLAAGATVTICHIHTRDLASHTRRAELLVVAVGKAGLITCDLVRPGAVVIDVGINRQQGQDGRMRTVGDVDPQVAGVAGAMTPVPGGVGELTTTVLLESTITAAERLSQATLGLDAAQIGRLLGADADQLPHGAAERIATMLARHLVGGLGSSRALRSRFERRLGGGVLLLDGAMGTELIDQGIARNGVLEANLAHPDVVLHVHRAYVEAGAEAITANTFGANRFRAGGREEAVRLAGAGVRLARQAALSATGHSVFVLGSIGPLGRVVGAELPLAAAEEAFAEVALAMADQGVDALILETMPSTAEAAAALAGCRRVTRLPVLACRSIDRDDAVELAAFARAMEEGGACAIGINCAAGPRALEQVVGTLARLTRLPVVARPNAGFPVPEDGRLRYPLRPAYLVERVRAYIAAGAGLVGGCCGVGPAHIRALAAALPGMPAPVRGAAAPAQPAQSRPPAPIHPVMLAAQQGRFPVLAMLPARIAPGTAVAAARRLVEAGADAVGLLGGWPGAARGARLAAQVRHLQDECGRPGILELLAGDMSLPLAQDIALTAHLLGIRLVLVDSGLFTGPAQGSLAASGCEPLAVVRMLKGLNGGYDLGGTRQDEPTAFAVGIRLRERELALAGEAAAAGADFIALPPIYEPARFRAGMAAAATTQVPLFAETLLLPDAATAEELDNELPELSVPERLKERLRGDSQEDVRGVLRFAQAWRKSLGGLIVMAADERTQPLEAVIAGVRRGGART